MLTELPRSLERVLLAQDGGADAVDAAWRAFVAEHTRLFLHVARSVLVTHDNAMDGYTFALEQLRADDFRRLREYSAEPQTKLSTWLVVVVRRLCLDLYRQRYGRTRGLGSQSQRTVRRRIQDLVTDGLAWHDLLASRAGSAELAIRQSELSVALDQAISALPPPEQLLLRLRFDDGLTAQEIARVLDFPSPFHVYRRINALLAEVRRALELRGVESSVP